LQNRQSKAFQRKLQIVQTTYGCQRWEQCELYAEPILNSHSGFPNAALCQRADIENFGNYSTLVNTGSRNLVLQKC